MVKYSLKQIFETDKRAKTYHHQFISYPLGNLITWIIANFTKITANQITLFRIFILTPLTFILFLMGDFKYILIGAIIFEFNYILDCVDGQVARLNKNSSKFGSTLDGFADSLKNLAIIFLAAGQFILTKNMILFYFIIAYSTFKFATMSIHSAFGEKLIQKLAVKQEKLNVKKNQKSKIIPYPTHAELEFFLYFLLPVLGFAYYAVFIALIFHIGYYIFTSTFHLIKGLKKI